MSDRIVRFSEASWQEVEALPEPLRWTLQRAIFHLLDEPVPTLADSFPEDLIGLIAAEVADRDAIDPVLSRLMFEAIGEAERDPALRERMGAMMAQYRG